MRALLLFLALTTGTTGTANAGQPHRWHVGR